MTRLFVSLVLAFGFSGLFGSAPNIVIVISDDMGYSDLGCYGGEIDTPRLDQLADRGLRFSNFYVNNMCWPTRASLLTGLYPKMALLDGSSKGGIRANARILPEMLRKAGYRSYMAGKWHLSDPAQPHGPSAPHKRGFDRSYSTYHGTSDFFAPVDLNLNGEDRDYEWQDNPNFYYTDAITDYSLKFLDEHRSSAQTRDRPFFLYVAYNAAHWPLHAKPEDIAAYKGRFSKGWDALRRERHERMKDLGVVNADWELSPRNPEVPAWKDEPHKDWMERRMEVYAAQVTCMDRNIGRIDDYLKAHGLRENTIVIYQQDNGGCQVEYPPTRKGSWTRSHTTDGNKTPMTPGNLPEIMPGPQSSWQSYGYGWANLSNTPFRLYKQHDHEGGTRSPLIVSWPDAIGKKRWGGLREERIHVMDMMPTLLEAAGLSVAKEGGSFDLEGQSFLSVIEGDSGGWEPQEALFWQHNKGRAARVGDWKLVAVGKGPWELYHLSEDGTELNDLAKRMPEKVKELEKAWEAWNKRTDLSGK
ncbi:MAG: arylsulfatase [Verrucomicrobiota bacterium]